MNQLTKAQFTVGLLACFALVWGLASEALDASDQVFAFILVGVQLIAILVLSVVILGILEWVKIFDLKTNSILTLLVLVTVRLISTL